jgi:hypothetical protein
VLDMGCIFSNERMGHEVAVPRPIASHAVAAIALAATASARDRWQRELAAWLGEQARSLAGGGGGFDVGDVAWTPNNFSDQQRFLVEAIAYAAAGETGELRAALDRLAALIAGHDRAWVVVGRRWSWPAGVAAPP